MGSYISSFLSSFSFFGKKPSSSNVELDLIQNNEKINHQSPINSDRFHTGQFIISPKKIQPQKNKVINSLNQISKGNNHMNYQRENQHTDSSLDQQIKKASTLSDKQAKQQLKKIAAYITQTKDKSFAMMQRLAFVESSLAQLHFNDNNSSECQKHENIALGFYTQFQSEYFQDIVVILNNKALRDEKNKRIYEAIKKYKSILQLQRRFLSINDQRRLLAMNNLACAYCEANLRNQGIKTFEELLAKIEEKKQGQLTELIKENYRYYTQKQ